MDVINTIGDLGAQAACLMTIDRLLADGYLQEQTSSTPKASYLQPDFNALPERMLSSVEGLELTILSQSAPPELWVEWAETLKISHLTGLVIVDDYLDPRLEAINRTYREQGRSWLLFKPTGHQPLLGPYFIRTERETPCWHCLAARLRLNQPVRYWLQNTPEPQLLPLPIHYDRESVTRVLATATALAQQLLDHQRPSRLWSFDLADGSSVEHAVNHRPQCPACGNPDLFTQKSAARLSLAALAPSPKSRSRDGGYRSRIPEQTVAALAPETSVLTGIVHDVSELPQQPNAGVTTCRSSFFTTPRSKARLEQNDFLKISLGKGISKEQSKASALCESVERHAAQYQGDEPQRLAQASQLDARAVLPSELAPFSTRQYEQFRDSNPMFHIARQAVEPHDPNTPLHWTLGHSLTRDEPVYVPLAYCYASTPFEDERYIRWNSNGCAAGNTLAEAVLQGFLEGSLR